MHTYLIYSIRMGAWIGPTGGISDFRLAKQYTRNAAMTYCAQGLDHENNPSAIPVRLDDLEQLTIETPFKATS